MKKVIFSEGKNDSYFSEKLFEVLKIKKYKIYNHKEKNTLKNIRYDESKYLRSFLQSCSPHEWLVKSEAGKSKLVNACSHFIMNLFDSQVKVIILVDLDGSDLKSFLLKLSRTIQSRRKGNKITLKHSFKESPHLITSVVSVIIDKNGKVDELGSIFIIAFKLSLEMVAKIKAQDTQKMKCEKIGKLVSCDEILTPCSSIIQS